MSFDPIKVERLYNNFAHCVSYASLRGTTPDRGEADVKRYLQDSCYNEDIINSSEWIQKNGQFLADKFSSIGNSCVEKIRTGIQKSLFESYEERVAGGQAAETAQEEYKKAIYAAYKSCFAASKEAYVYSATTLADEQVAAESFWNNFNFEDLTYMEMGGTALSIGAVAATTFYFLNKSYQAYTSFRRVDGTKNLILGITAAAAGIYAGIHYYSQRI